MIWYRYLAWQWSSDASVTTLSITTFGRTNYFKVSIFSIYKTVFERGHIRHKYQHGIGWYWYLNNSYISASIRQVWSNFHAYINHTHTSVCMVIGISITVLFKLLFKCWLWLIINYWYILLWIILYSYSNFQSSRSTL